MQTSAMDQSTTSAAVAAAAGGIRTFQEVADILPANGCRTLEFRVWKSVCMRQVRARRAAQPDSGVRMGERRRAIALSDGWERALMTREWLGAIENRKRFGGPNSYKVFLRGSDGRSVSKAIVELDESSPMAPQATPGANHSPPGSPRR